MESSGQFIFQFTVLHHMRSVPLVEMTQGKLKTVDYFCRNMKGADSFYESSVFPDRLGALSKEYFE